MKYETECKYLKYFNLKIYKSHNLGEKNKQMQEQNQEFLKVQGIVHKQNPLTIINLSSYNTDELKIKNEDINQKHAKLGKLSKFHI